MAFGETSAQTMPGRRLAEHSPTDGFSADTLAALFRQSATRHAERPALWVDGDSVSYGDLLLSADGSPTAWSDAGYADGTRRCAILGNRGLIDFAGILGALLARCTYVPLNVRHPHATACPNHA